MFEIEIARLAAVELAEAAAWYEEQETGLSEELFRDLEGVKGRLATMPTSFPVARGETRRALLKRFPYAVYFKLVGDSVVITAFFHARRDSKHLLGR